MFLYFAECSGSTHKLATKKDDYAPFISNRQKGFIILVLLNHGRGGVLERSRAAEAATDRQSIWGRW